MSLPHLASRIFGQPLLISRPKLDIILSVLGPRLGLDMPQTEAAVPQERRDRKPYAVTPDGIAVIDIVGPLVMRRSGDALSGGPTTYGQIESEFLDALGDPSIKGILLEMDSPGGESSGVWELADLIYQARGNKPVWANANTDAYSAAYALASAAERLTVTKSGGLGSIGVWALHVDQSGYNEKVGIKPTYIFAGARKVDLNPHQPLTDEARASLQAWVDGAYEMFVETVARNRRMDAKSVRATEAEIYRAADAVARGLGDAVETFNDTLANLTEHVKSSTRPSFSMAASASMTPQQKEVSVEDTKTNAAAEQTVVAPEAAIAEARAGGFRTAVEIVQLCAIAGFSAKQALPFLADSKADIEGVRKAVLEAKAKTEGTEEIHSHIMPGDGADAKDKGADYLKAAADSMKGGKA